MKVMKFGGSSLADADALARVAGIIVSRAQVPLVVVVSAMGATTDRLVEIADAAAEGRRADATKVVDELEKYHREEAAAAVRPDAHAELEAFLETHFHELREIVGGLATLGELTPQSADEAAYFAAKVQPRLSPGGAIWTVYPSETSPDRVAFDVSMADLVHAMAKWNLVDRGTVQVSESSTSTCFRPLGG